MEGKGTACIETYTIRIIKVKSWSQKTKKNIKLTKNSTKSTKINQ